MKRSRSSATTAGADEASNAEERDGAGGGDGIAGDQDVVDSIGATGANGGGVHEAEDDRRLISGGWASDSSCTEGPVPLRDWSQEIEMST
jgi:hypothetical protein